ncbi:hypothetical protein C8J30_103307 [Rhodobacter viridis]|uniref:Porin domain-containing protein n=1 Tax=Rhodobacter viridis TaxID=1054202 RepID=A0A318U0J3_9RHOB|nr:porin [Rhodobacter viridis]PYF11211.1 hypothetical protein C8J30_103307 [Rhodobacter viridis]
MKRIFLCMLACSAISAPVAQAADVTGATLGLDYSAFTDDTGGTANKTALSGSVELGFDRNFSLQGDMSIGHFGLTDVDTFGAAVHGIYHASEFASVGAFIGRDSIEGDGDTFYGAEAGFEQGQFSGNVYVSHMNDPLADGTLMGIGGAYKATDAFTLGASYDNIDVDSYDLSRAQLEAEYRMDNFAVTAQLGSADAEGFGSETYFGVGAKVTFGAKRGTTFEQRGLLAIWPGL